MFVTDPDTQLTEELAMLGKNFLAEAGYPVQFHVEHWLSCWRTLIKAKMGFIWLLTHFDRPVGGIGVLLSPDLCDGNLVMQEAFWYVDPEHRGGTASVRLVKEVEAFAKEAGVARFSMGRAHDADPEGRVDAFLKAMGYVPRETNYIKTIN